METQKWSLSVKKILVILVLANGLLSRLSAPVDGLTLERHFAFFSMQMSEGKITPQDTFDLFTKFQESHFCDEVDVSGRYQHDFELSILIKRIVDWMKSYSKICSDQLEFDMNAWMNRKQNEMRPTFNILTFPEDIFDAIKILIRTKKEPKKRVKNGWIIPKIKIVENYH